MMTVFSVVQRSYMHGSYNHITADNTNYSLNLYWRYKTGNIFRFFFYICNFLCTHIYCNTVHYNFYFCDAICFMFMYCRFFKHTRRPNT